MDRETHRPRPTRRREFLSQVSAAAAGAGLLAGSAAAAEPDPKAAPKLPTIELGEHRISRLVAGWNPIGGYSYLGPHMNRHMREYFTPERIVEFLQRCERAGITAHQFSRPEMMAPILKTLREQGSRMKFYGLHSGDAAAIEQAIELTSPFALAHHGGATDRMFRDGKSGQVRDYVNRVRDAGLLAGVSAHNPDNIKQVADEGWPVDFFMCCFYYLTRTPEELASGPPIVTEQIGYPFFSGDPARMTEVMRQVDQPCLGFKILGAGRKSAHKHTVRTAFEFAFEHIKPTDGVIVGMYPRFDDEVGENAKHVRELGRVG